MMMKHNILDFSPKETPKNSDAITGKCLLGQSSVHTFTAGRIPCSVTDNVSDLDNKLLKSSSLVSAPVFFVLGELTKREISLLKEEAVLILSA